MSIRNPLASYAAFKKNDNPTTTSRGVMWLGSPCDVKCVFCYCHGRENKPWMKLDGVDSSTETATMFREKYKNTHIDFMGGEPTLYPHILPLLKHCRTIGLLPTVITNGRRFAKMEELQKFIDAGLHDVLLSVHAVRKSYDKIIPASKPGGQDLVEACMKNLQAAGIPFRVNTTLIEWNREDLKKIVEMIAPYGAKVINFISYNPYYDWAKQTDTPFQAKFSDLAPNLIEAIDECNVRGIEANVRYFPLCLLPGYEKHLYNNHQLPYDQREWDFNSWFDCNEMNASSSFYLKQAKVVADTNGYVKGEKCKSCSASEICDGIHSQYLNRFGESELRPFQAEPILDPTYFIKNQFKCQASST